MDSERAYEQTSRLPTAVCLITCLVIAASCTNMHDACPATDWYEIGHAAGEIGGDEEYFRQYAELCAGQAPEPDRTAWLAGYRDGLKTYCSMEEAYYRGFTGRYYYVYTLCPVDQQDALLAELRRGARCESLLPNSRSSSSDDDDFLDPDYDPDKELARAIAEAVAEAVVDELFDRQGEWERLGCY